MRKEPPRIYKRILWFILLWVAGFTALAVIATLIKAVMPS